jgi:hypothetical protein
MVASAQRGPSGPTGGPLIGGVENREEILGNDHRKHVQKARERPGTGSSVQASERRCEWEGATPFALIPRRGRIPLPLNPRIRAPHTIDLPRPDIKRNILGMPASSPHTANASIRVRPERPPQAASLASRARRCRRAQHPLALRERESLGDKEPSQSASNLLRSGKGIRSRSWSGRSGKGVGNRLWSRREVKIRHRGSARNQNNGLSQLVCPQGAT